MKTKHEIRTEYKFKTGMYWDDVENTIAYTEYLENKIIEIEQKKATTQLEPSSSHIGDIGNRISANPLLSPSWCNNRGGCSNHMCEHQIKDYKCHCDTRG